MLNNATINIRTKLGLLIFREFKEAFTTETQRTQRMHRD